MGFVYYKFKCFKGGLRSLPTVGRFISVYDFKSEIFVSKYYGHGKDFDFMITDANTDQLFADDSSPLIPACSSVVIRRLPGLPQLPIVVGDAKLPKIENNPSSSSALKDLEEHESFDFHDFGPDIYSISQTLTAIQSDTQTSTAIQSDTQTSTVIQSNTHCKQDKINVGFKFLPEKSYVKAFVGKTQIQIPPPQGYVCHRCKVTGHYIQHCPTNGDPNFDLQKVNYKSASAIGISKTSVSSSNSSGITYASASISSSHSSVGPKIAPELYCPLCNNVMKDAALTKCCFASFCDKCIRDRIVSNSDCVCQRKIVADDILPNMTLRQTINRILNVNQSGKAECKRKHQLIAESEKEQKKIDLSEAAEHTRKRQRKEILRI